MIKLTKHNGDPIWLNPDQIRTIDQDKYATLVCDHHIKETPEEVVRKIVEYKLSMEDYRQSAGEYKTLARYSLEDLAGLEQTP